MSALRAACLTTFGSHVATTDETTAHAGRPIDGTCITSDRDNVATRVMHVATVRDVPARGGWYRVRTWHELATVSPN